MSDINHVALVEHQQGGKLHPMFNILVAGALAVSGVQHKFPEEIQQLSNLVSQAMGNVRLLPNAPVVRFPQKYR